MSEAWSSLWTFVGEMKLWRCLFISDMISDKDCLGFHTLCSSILFYPFQKFFFSFHCLFRQTTLYHIYAVITSEIVLIANPNNLLFPSCSNQRTAFQQSFFFSNSDRSAVFECVISACNANDLCWESDIFPFITTSWQIWV